MMNTVNDLVTSIESTPNPRALNYLDKMGKWHSISSEEFLHQARSLSTALKVLGLKRGDKVAIMAPPTHLWSICDFGILLGGFVAVPIFHNISEDNFVLETLQSESKVIFVMGATGHQFCQKYIDNFDKIISLDASPFFQEELLYKDFIALGEDALSQNQFEPQLLSPDDTATIIYTSGTTAIPKGVELTQKNIFCMLDGALNRIKINNQDRFLSFLPLAHILGRLVNFAMLSKGIAVYYLSDITALLTSLKEVKPTVIAIVPRLVEKFYNTIQYKCGEGNPLRKTMATWAFNYLNRPYNDTSNVFAKFFADRILGCKIRKLFGNHLRVMVSGSAKLDEKYFNFFNNAGVPLLEGYGLTEACPGFLAALNANRVGKIGTRLEGVEAKISPEGELLLRGALVMKGYYLNPGATAAFITHDGWLHTGDQGKIDEEGFLTLQGRMSDKCKTSYGEFIDKPSLEELTNQLPFVDFSTIIGENRPFVTCLLFPDYDALDRLKKQMDLRNVTYEEMLRMDFIQREIKRSLEEINAHLNPGERIRDFRFVFNKASIEGGELSPTMKARHAFIEKKYTDLINEMYPKSYWES